MNWSKKVGVVKTVRNYCRYKTTHAHSHSHTDTPHRVKKVRLSEDEDRQLPDHGEHTNAAIPAEQPRKRPRNGQTDSPSKQSSVRDDVSEHIEWLAEESDDEEGGAVTSHAATKDQVKDDEGNTHE